MIEALSLPLMLWEKVSLSKFWWSMEEYSIMYRLKRPLFKDNLKIVLLTK